MPEQNGVELRWILAVIRRWIWLIALCTSLAVVVAFIVTAQMTPYYEATAILLIQPAQETRATDFSALAAGERLALTYSEMLKSGPVLAKVVSQNQLSTSADQLAKRVSAQPIRDTQLIHLTVKDASPTVAATIANGIASAFTLYIQTIQAERYAGTIKNTLGIMEEISLQMDAIQSEIQTLNAKKVGVEAELAKFQSLMSDYKSSHQQLQQEYQSLQLTVSTLTDSISVAEAAQAFGDTTPITATITLLFDQTWVAGEGSYSVGTYEKILAGRPVLEAAIERLALRMDPDMLAKQISVVAVPGTQLIELNVADADRSQALLLAETIAEIFIDQMETLKEEPYINRLSNLQVQIDRILRQLEGAQVAIAGLTPDYLALETRITSLERQLAEYRSDYRALQQDLNQMQLATEIAADAVVIAEPASIPKSYTQHRVLYIGLAGTVSGLIALGTGFLLEYLNDVLRTPEDIRQVYNLSTLGSIPLVDEPENELVTVAQPRSPVAEAFRMLATNISITGMDLPLRTILVTSANAQEGKSMVVANLAVVLTQRELRVVVVDADLRLPRQHNLFELDIGRGLTGALLDENANGELQQVSVEGLKVLTSGDIPANPAEVIASKRMLKLIDELAQDANLVLIDCPPVLPVADAAILGSIVDGVLLVVNADRTRRREMRDAVENLGKVGANLLGVVLNGISSRRDQYYQYYGGESGHGVNGKHSRKKTTRGLMNLFGKDGSHEKKSSNADPEVDKEKKHLADAAWKKHIAEMNALAQREEQAWEAVDHLLSKGRKIASVYDNATAQLKKLAQLAEFKQTHPAFHSRIHAFAEKYAKRSALIERWRREGWV